MHKKEKKSAAEVVMTMLHAGGKFDQKSYKVSGGLHGVGVSVVNALSKRLDLEIKREGGIYTQSYERGNPVAKLKLIGKTKKTGTKVTFWPDEEIFETTEYNFDDPDPAAARAVVPQQGPQDHDHRRADEQVPRVPVQGRHPGVRQVPQPEQETSSIPSRSCSRARRTASSSRWPSSTTVGYAETIFSFVNNINTTEGGTHLIGFKAALTRSLNTYAGAHNLLKDLSARTSPATTPARA